MLGSAALFLLRKEFCVHLRSLTAFLVPLSVALTVYIVHRITKRPTVESAL